MEQSRIIAVANQKGGVAKTTTAVNLAAYLGEFGQRVLLIDLDPQANATSGLGIDKDSVEKSIYEVLIGSLPLGDILRESSSKNVTVAPANLALVGAEVELVNAERRERRLAESVNRADFSSRFDITIIDTPPSLGLLTINALAAAHSVLIPMQCEYYAMEGLAQLYKTIQLVRQSANPALHIEGLVFSMVDPRANLTVQVMQEVKRFLQDKVYDTIIPRNVRLAEAPGFGQPIASYDRHSRGAEAYRQLAQEFLRRHGTPVAPPLAAADVGRIAGDVVSTTSPEANA